MADSTYLMESNDECFRLDLKTYDDVIERQAAWAGVKPGMQVADIGCGPGRTTICLSKLVKPDGCVVGIDASESRIAYAREHFPDSSVDYMCRNILEDLKDLGTFDFIWVRFVLEYYRSRSLEIVKNLRTLLNPGGILCLIDLDYNCMNHYELPVKLEATINSIIKRLEEEVDFDPYAGRKLYSYLYDIGLENIQIDVSAHHIIYGNLQNVDAYNWEKKIEIAAKRIGYEFEEYTNGYDEFLLQFRKFFYDKRRFTYTPIICCRGCLP